MTIAIVVGYLVIGILVGIFAFTITAVHEQNQHDQMESAIFAGLVGGALWPLTLVIGAVLGGGWFLYKKITAPEKIEDAPVKTKMRFK